MVGIFAQELAIDPDAKKMWRATLRFSAVGLEMGVAVAIGYGLGWWLDAPSHASGPAPGAQGVRSPLPGASFAHTLHTPGLTRRGSA